MSGPLIKEIHIIPIAIVDPPLVERRRRIIVELVTDDGISGISGIPANSSIDQALELSRDLLIGKDVFQLNEIRQVLTNYFGTESASQRGDLTHWIPHYPWESNEVIVGGRIKFEEGSVLVPTRSELGVELDRKALKVLHQNYLDYGLKKRDDEIEMQKVVSEWKFKAVRW